MKTIRQLKEQGKKEAVDEVKNNGVIYQLIMTTTFLKEFENPEVVCMLDEKEYIELVYAMYCSPHTKNTHKKVLNKILEEYYSKRNV